MLLLYKNALYWSGCFCCVFVCVCVCLCFTTLFYFALNEAGAQTSGAKGLKITRAEITYM